MKIQELEIGQIVYRDTDGEGVIVEIVDEFDVKVNFAGIVKRCMAAILKNKPAVKKVKNYMKEVNEIDEKVTFQTIVNELRGSNRTSTLFFSPESIYVKLEKLAFSQNHFSGDILERARKNPNAYISDKQACAVAYFAKENNLI